MLSSVKTLTFEDIHVYGCHGDLGSHLLKALSGLDINKHSQHMPKLEKFTIVANHRHSLTDVEIANIILGRAGEGRFKFFGLHVLDREIRAEHYAERWSRLKEVRVNAQVIGKEGTSFCLY